jgi:hypothetical protein
MDRFFTERKAREEAILCANLYGGVWCVLKYETYWDVQMRKNVFKGHLSLVIAEYGN